ncbi:MAG TPA: DNA-directed RNA polymerase subunit H [Candidatus Nanoarchaeia archaeon]|nr:DNA-directed RNA polymerase subunit H [Candidatus Nanoarchaeia archaeon]
MAFHVSEHIWVPQHKKLSKEEKEALLEKYHITVKELPRISKHDSVLSELSAEPGDVVKITRNSATAGKATYYRVVSNG